MLEYVESAKEKHFEKVAFSDGMRGLSFGEIWEKSRRVGSGILRRMGEGFFGKPVVVFMEKSPEMLLSFFGTIYSGNFYVPLDKEMPSARISMIFQDLQPEFVIVDEKTEKLAKSFCGDSVMVVSLGELCESEVLEGELLQIRERSIDIDPIYLIFTSGSTGKPKGVLANHRSVVDYVEELSRVLSIDEETIFGNQAPFYVDACLKEIFPTFRCGGMTYLIPKSLFMFPVKLIDFLNEHKINTICWVVTAFTIVSSFGGLREKKILYLRTVAFGSEVFPRKDFEMWRGHLPEARFFHLYGPTEATGMSTYYEVGEDVGERIPIGKGFRNTEVFLLDEGDGWIFSGERGKVGEICIRGTCLTMGYYGDFGLTDSVFVQNPAVSAYRDLIYRTGDLGEYNDSGELLYVSRKDFQVKHLGHRIELGEIEVATLTLEGVLMACCVYLREEKKLVLYYVGEEEEKGVQNGLKKLLPRYMLPSKVVKREELPVTLNGKIDRVLLRKESENIK